MSLPAEPTYAIILTHNRPDLLDRCVRATFPQVDQVIVVDNASDPPANPPLLAKQRSDYNWAIPSILAIPDQPPNLSRMWNIAFDRVRKQMDDFDDSEPWNLIMLCDDADIPPGWVEPLTTAMRQHDAHAAYTNSRIHTPTLKTAPDQDIMNRMPGWAFALRGETRLRADERLHWWWCDTHLDWLARKAGGMLIVPGPDIPNLRPGEYTNAKPELGEQAGRDGKMFAEIWGWRPW